MKIFFKTILITLLLILALPVLASDIRVQTLKKDVIVSEEFLADVHISSKQSLNAIEGTLFYPSDLLNVKEIRDGASVINFWIEKPKVDKVGEISFSGITPGGFSGEDNLVFSVLFTASKAGSATVELQNMKVLLNDGAGTADPSTFSSATVSITAGENAPRAETLVDTELPEDFVPILSRDPNLFDGKYFIVFATQDKISGIDYYEVREGHGGEFNKAESPYLLQNQTLSKKIFLHAVDKAGNIREVVFNPKKSDMKYKTSGIFAIIPLLLILAYLFWKKLWRKSIN